VCVRVLPRRPTRLLLGAVGGVVALLGLTQLLLPRLAAHRMRDELARYGPVYSTSISAFPALELLWRHAQSASASMGPVTMTTAQANSLLWKARGVGRLDLHATAMHVGPLAMQQVVMRKRGTALSIQGRFTAADLRAALPAGAEAQILGSTPAGIEVRVSGSVFGVGSSLHVLLSARDGRLVGQPTGVPFAGALTLTLFSAPHMYVRSLALADGSSTAGGAGYRMSLTATLR
jgi:hypothetical protein